MENELNERQNNQNERRSKSVMEYIKSQLTEAVQLNNEGQKANADTIVEDLKEMINNMIEQEEVRMPSNSWHESFDRKILPGKGKVLRGNDKIILRAFSDEDYEDYIAVAHECSSFPGAFKDEEFKKNLWEEVSAGSSASYSIILKETGEFAGYVGIKDLKAKYWELAIELFGKFRHKGYGYNAMVVLLDAMSELTGETLYRSRVDPDNYASQSLMKKIGGRPDGISEMIIYGEKLEKFQEENRNLITDKLSAVADEFCVDPIDLIGRVLEFRIEWKIETEYGQRKR